MTTAGQASSGNSAERKSVTAPLRILSLNAHQGYGFLGRRNVLAGLRVALRSAGADLVFLQEVGGGSDRQHDHEVLADTVWHEFAYARNAVTGRGHHGNALLSKYPIRSWRNVDASVAGAEPRGLLHAVVEGPFGLLHAVCVHLGLRESHRRRQVAALLDLLRRDVPSRAPVVVAGDFNDWAGRAHRVLAGPLVEVHGARPARTFPAACPLFRLDRVYVRDLAGTPVTVPRRPWAWLSDHVPVVADVEPRRRF